MAHRVSHVFLALDRGPGGGDKLTELVLPGVIGWRAPPGEQLAQQRNAARPMAQQVASATIHRMGVDTIVKEVEAAGFKLAVNSDLLANPKDDRKKMVFEPGERGHTDQAVFVFEKPRT